MTDSAELSVLAHAGLTDKLWIYERFNGWHAHIDWATGRKSKVEGPFTNEGQAALVMSRKYGNSTVHEGAEQ